jgi:hypothetical protein
VAAIGFSILLLGLSACSIAPVDATTSTSPSIESLEEVLGTLIVFASFMLVLAVGTEAMIDVVKVATGFQSKPTALDSVKKLREWLPEQVKTDGGDESKVSQLLETLDRLEKVVGDAEQGALAISVSREWIEKSLQDFNEGKITGLFSFDLAGLEQAMKEKGVETARIDEVKRWLHGSYSAFQARTVKDLLSRFDVLLGSIPGLTAEQRKKSCFLFNPGYRRRSPT